MDPVSTVHHADVGAGGEGIANGGGGEGDGGGGGVGEDPAVALAQMTKPPNDTEPSADHENVSPDAIATFEGPDDPLNTCDPIVIVS